MPKQKIIPMRIIKAFPARPKRILNKARIKASEISFGAPRFGLPIPSNMAYIAWLKKRSMLFAAKKQARKYSGKSELWRNRYGKPQPRTAVRKGSVWYTSYPISLITNGNTSTIEGLADEKLWDVFEDIGITGLHTGPMKQAGGLTGWKYTPSIDGHFDRISNDIDGLFGTEREFKKLTEVANKHNAIIIDDIVPGHTGKGPDFRLAEMACESYPGIYHMVEIDEADWHLLPVVPRKCDSVNINQETEEALKRAGYIVGRLQRIIFYEPGIKDTNWSATKVVRGVDGKKRRWVYLHYFKDGQPTLNWLDPTFAAMQLVAGDALHSLGTLGTSGLRLDANGFLGVEITDPNQPAWSEGHPLSSAANHMIAGMVRKAGGFTFQELNLSFDDIRDVSRGGADLSYDFINRPAYHHAFITADTSFLRLSLSLARKYDIEPVSLVHALQNHDELTYELVHFFSVHKDDIFMYKGKKTTGTCLRDTIQSDIRSALIGEHAPYNAPFTMNGIACTTVSSIAAVFKYDIQKSLSPNELQEIIRAHLLLSAFNALQPGVFALSGWDLVGALPLNKHTIDDLLVSGDTRWLTRGAYDLMGTSPHMQDSSLGMPRTKVLYGSLPEQLADTMSYASQLKRMLQVRDNLGIATAKQLEILDIKDMRILALLHELEKGKKEITLLNFSNEHVTCTITSHIFKAHETYIEAFSGQPYELDKKHTIHITLAPYAYSCLVEQ